MGTHVAPRPVVARQVLPVAFVASVALAWVARLLVDGARPFQNDEFWLWVAVLTGVGAAGVVLALTRPSLGWRVAAGTALGIAVAILAVFLQTLARSA
ncbi:hypothetical protein GCM10009623_06490 [Nocardioides aestuarii]|uniref:Uncharacterized protein n=1 Tax=Nocardioides aestuarii TaxID=252231 RepID=A0ABW4TIG8_9ACTN